MHEQSLRVCMIPFDTNKTKAGNTQHGVTFWLLGFKELKVETVA